MGDNPRVPDAWDPDNRVSPTDIKTAEDENPETGADGQPRRTPVEIDFDAQLQGYESEQNQSTQEERRRQ